MDYLDLQIFRSLGFLPYGHSSGDLSRLNPWVIAKKVSADGKTVRSRLDKMKKSGFIQYFQIYPNFRLLGLNGVGYVFDVGDVLRKSEVIEKCSLVDGVTEIHNFIGTKLCVDFACQDGTEEDRRLELFRNLTLCDRPMKFYERVMPPVRTGLSHLDWEIVKALRYDAFKPLSTVASQLGVTARTVRRRFERMTKSNAVIIVPVINPAQIADTISYALIMYPDPERWSEIMEAVMSMFNHSYFLTRMYPPNNAVLFLTARTLAETEEGLINARKIDGMKSVGLLVLKEVQEYTKWLDSTIERKIRETSAPAGLEPSVSRIDVRSQPPKNSPQLSRTARH